MIIRSQHSQGFTLIEMSIVLVIIGLIIGGILTGRDMIRQAELQSILKQADSFRSAVYTFRTKYNAVPGDMAKATNIWGASDSNPTTCVTTPSTGTSTCNGNGDDRIAYCQVEPFLAWKHLANAGLVSGNFTGITADPAELCQASIAPLQQNVPTTSIATNAAWFLSTYPKNNSVFRQANFTHMLLLGTIGIVPSGVALTAKEAYALDTKYDDGRPATGKFITSNATVQVLPCTNDNSVDATYQLNTTEIRCMVIIDAGF